MGLKAINEMSIGQTDAVAAGVQQGNGYEGLFEENTVIEGTVIETTDSKVSVRFENGDKSTELKFDKSSIQGAYKGEKRSFKVVKVTSESVVLRDMGGVASESGKMIFTAVNSEQLSLVEGFRDVMGDGGEEKGNALRSVYSRMSEEDCESFWEEGFSMEEYSAQQLTRALERIKLTAEIKQMFTEGSVESLQQKEQDIEKISEQSIAKTARQKMIAKQLKRANLPVTEENLASVENAMTLAAGIHNVTEGAKAYLIKNEQPPTVENLYTSMHRGAPREVNLTDGVWNELKAQAGGILKQANEEMPDGVPAAQEEDARWLLEKDLPLTAENIVYKKKLDTLRVDEETVMKNAVEQLRAGEGAQEAFVTEEVEQEDGRQTTADSLRNVRERLSAELTGDISLVTARRRLEEIRLEMTVEVRQSMSQQGIDISVESIEALIEDLKGIENDYYRRCCAEAGIGETDAGISALAGIEEQLDTLRNAPSYVLGVTYTSRTVITVQELSAEGGRMALRLDAARETYEAVGTQVRADLGDNIRTAFRNVDELLSLGGFEVNEANRRAVRILGYNGMEISRENLEGIKNYDDKVNRVLENMKPVVAAELVKRGINPLDMSVDDLNNVLDGIYDEMGYDSREKYSEFLVRLDRMGELDEAERSAYIGIYRLLNRLQKSDGAVIGSVYESGGELTLGNLLSADRTRRRGQLNVSIDDTFGGLVDVVERGISISRQILGCITPEKLSKLESSGKEPVQMSLDTMLEELRVMEDDAEARDELTHQRLEQLREASLAENSEAEFLKLCSQPDSVTNIMVMKELLQSPDTYNRIKRLLRAGESVDEQDTSISADELTDRETLETKYAHILDEQEEIIDDFMDEGEITSADSIELGRLGSHVTLLKALARREFYELPLRTADGGIAQVNLTIVHDEENSGQVRIRLRGEKGCSMELHCTKGTVRGLVTCADSETAARMRESLSGAGDKLEKIGYTVETLHISVGDITEQSYMRRSALAIAGGSTESVKTSDLYAVAGVFVGCTVSE